MTYRRSTFVLLAFLPVLAACERGRGPGRGSLGAPAGAAGFSSGLVGEWSSAARTDANPETIIFARDQSVVLRESNAELRLAASVPSGGKVVYEVDASTSPSHLDLVVQNVAGETVSRVPGIVKLLTDDQIQYCVDFATLTRPVDFNSGCVVLTKLSGTGPRQAPSVVQERVIVQQAASAPAASGATANSPGDGFVALRSAPSVRYGYRVLQIPHGAYVEMYSCQPAEAILDRRRGQWCEVGYNGTRGWAFDGFLLRQ